MEALFVPQAWYCQCASIPMNSFIAFLSCVLTCINLRYVASICVKWWPLIWVALHYYTQSGTQKASIVVRLALMTLVLWSLLSICGKGWDQPLNFARSVAVHFPLFGWLLLRMPVSPFLWRSTKSPGCLFFDPKILHRKNAPNFPKAFEDIFVLPSWETDTTANSPDISAMIQCPIPKQIHRKKSRKFSGERAN